MEEARKSPSTAQKPDLDWSQVRETVLMLNLAVAHIERAMREGDDSVTALADSFTSMAGHVQAMGAAAAELPPGPARDSIVENCRQVGERVQAAIVAFQFYDRLTQRLDHVANSLGALAGLVGDPQRLYSPYAWRALQEKIKSRYTIAADRAMFDALLAGASVQEALEQGRQEGEGGEDVELF